VTTLAVARIGLARDSEHLGLEGLLVEASKLASLCQRADVPLRIGRRLLRRLASCGEGELRFAGHVFGLSTGQVRELIAAVAAARSGR
jgi:hypothetical protein